MCYAPECSCQFDFVISGLFTAFSCPWWERLLTSCGNQYIGFGALDSGHSNWCRLLDLVCHGDSASHCRFYLQFLNPCHLCLSTRNRPASQRKSHEPLYQLVRLLIPCLPSRVSHRIGVRTIAGLNDVQTGHVGHVLCAVRVITFFTWGWKFLPSRPPTRKLPEGHHLLLEGFRQNWRSFKKFALTSRPFDCSFLPLL